jgi:hypothetical protein
MLIAQKIMRRFTTNRSPYIAKNFSLIVLLFAMQKA